MRAHIPRRPRGSPPNGFASVEQTGSDGWAPSGGTQYPFVLILHASGAGETTLAYGAKYQALTDSGLGYSGDTLFKWAVQQGLPAGTVTARPSDNHYSSVTLGNVEGYWLGYTHQPPTERMHLISERRLDRLMRWIDANVPQAHATKRYITGGSMGAWGSVTYGMRRAHKFAAIYPDRPRVRYSSVGNISLPDYEGSSGVYAVGSAPLLADEDGGYSSATHLDLVAWAGNTANTMPWMGWCIGKADGYSDFSDHVALVAAMRAAGRGFAFAWNSGNHSEGSIIAQITDSYPYGTFELGVGYPVFSEHSLDADLSAATGGINVGLSFRNVVESASAWSCEVTHISSACTVKVKPKSSIYTGNPSPTLVTIPSANTWVTVSF